MRAAPVRDVIDPITLGVLGSQILPGLLGGAGGTEPGGPGTTPATGIGAGITGLASKIGSLFGLGPDKPTRGQIRRQSARAAVSQSPPLLRIQAALSGRNATPAEIEAGLRVYLPRDPEAREALAGILARARQLGGLTSKQGDEADWLGSVLTFVLLGTNKTALQIPPLATLIAITLGQAGASVTPVATPPPVVTPPATLAAPAPAGLQDTTRFPSSSAAGFAAVREFVSGATPASFTPTDGGPMGNFLDSLNAVAGGVSQLFAPSPASSAGLGGFVLPGGAMAAGLAGLSNLLPSVGLPFIDIAPSGGAALFEPFRRTASGARAQLHIQVNPATDKPEFFAPVGRPLIFSRDFATVKRMKRLGGRMVTATGGNRGRMVRRRRGGR